MFSKATLNPHYEEGYKFSVQYETFTEYFPREDFKEEIVKIFSVSSSGFRYNFVKLVK